MAAEYFWSKKLQSIGAVRFESWSRSSTSSSSSSLPSSLLLAVTQVRADIQLGGGGGEATKKRGVGVEGERRGRREGKTMREHWQKFRMPS